MPTSQAQIYQALDRHHPGTVPERELYNLSTKVTHWETKEKGIN